MKFHPAAEIFSLIEGVEFDRLVEDIRTNGLLEPIWVHPEDGSIIDGRNRYRACIEAGIAPTTRTWDGEGSLVEFVLSLNLHRRHLDASQKACAAAKALPKLEEEARARQIALAGTRTGDLRAKLPEGELGRARARRPPNCLASAPVTSPTPNA